MQWTKKRVLAGEAMETARDEERRLLEGAAGKGELALVNPADAGYAGPVSAPAGTLPAWKDEAGAIQLGQRGAKAPFPVDTPEMVFWADLPARSTRRFRAAGRRKSIALFEGIESPFYRLVCDDATGRIADLLDKRLGGSLCDASADWGLGELIHERAKSGSREMMYDLSKGITSPDSKRPCPEFERVGGHRTARRIVLARGPVFNGIVTRGSVPGARFVREVRLYHGGPRVEVLLHVEKQVVTTYESLYVAFPFAGAEPAVFVENAGAAYRPGAEQLPGSATDWHSVGDYVSVSDGRRTIVLVPLDAPVAQVGGIHTGKWQKRLAVGNGHVYSWIMNNMWFTNFPAFQEGVVTLAYALTSQAGAFDRAAAQAFASSVRQGVALAIGPAE